MKILLITPEFFGYEHDIEKSLVKLGHKVDWFPHIHAPNNLYKALYRFMGFLMRPQYYRYILSKINLEADYDKIVVIKGEGVGLKLLTKFKALFPKAKLIFYNWDSFENNSLNQKELAIYDKVKSFDSEDCEKNKEIEHLPLFYSNDFKMNESVDTEYLFYFAGTLHSNRYVDVNNIVSTVKNEQKNYLYFYCQSKSIFYLKKIFGKLPKNLHISKVGFDKKSKKELRNMLLKSDCVIDICHHLQVGLTMRTIEALGMKKKIVTNNSSVINYDFYNKDNIYVIGKSRCALDDFLRRPYSTVPDYIYKSYDIDNWVIRLIN
ncbi:hypothetical protein [Shewanella algae]|uniref:hypothetical protein n=1 Tax=Shewanella algae TaxID=38313 RepID=UPI0031F53C34